MTRSVRFPRRGGVYYVKDELVTLLPREDRQLHDRRPVVVLSINEMNNRSDWPVVLVVPTSSEPDRATPFCVEIKKNEGNLNKRTWARVPAVQPLEKADLGDYLGDLPGPRLTEILSRLADYMLA
jgi:mRNA-degrading endonuclease toxin of MazEF toxin-antitoxin module